jgi:hypothetical protein
MEGASYLVSTLVNAILAMKYSGRYLGVPSTEARIFIRFWGTALYVQETHLSCV